MINGKTVLAVIPARGGSKGVPGKNLREWCGKPLIAWSIEQAKKSKYIDRVIISSDDEQIIACAKRFGGEVPFVRPAALAQDHTPMADVISHAIRMVPGYDFVVLLQPTSPLRTPDDIDSCILKCVESGAPACVSVTEVKTTPYWMYLLDDNYRLMPILQHSQQVTRRQDAPIIYELNGAIYIAKTDWFLKTKTFLTKETVGYVMRQERSMDLDTELDFIASEWLMKTLEEQENFS